MSFTYHDKTGAYKPSDGDTDHGDELRANIDMFGDLFTPARSMFVSNDTNHGFSTSNYPALANATDRRHYNTIQGAIDAVEAKNPGYTDRWTVYIYPGKYEENITYAPTLTQSAQISLVGLGPQVSNDGQGATRGAEIRGTTSSQGPLVTITFPNGYLASCTFTNIFFHPQYNQTAGAIADAAILSCGTCSSYSGYQNRIEFNRCCIRGSCYGSGNDWQYGIKVSGFHKLNLIDTTYDTNANVGDGYHSMIYIQSDDTLHKQGNLFIKRSDLYHHSYTGSYGIPAMIVLDSGTTSGDAVHAKCGQSTLQKTSTGYVLSNVGSYCTDEGLSAGTLGDYGNLEIQMID